MKFFLINKITDENKKQKKISITSSRIKCYLVTKRLLKEGYIVKVTYFKYPMIRLYETFYYPY